jgi:diguanylate cyclase (GGDEF)-like protein/PAS domain S-box-containing protein
MVRHASGLTFNLRTARPLTRTSLFSYRALTFVGFLLLLSFHKVHTAAEPTAIDPVGERLLVAFASLAVFFLSFVIRTRAFLLALYALYYIVTFWILRLLVLNEFAPEYAIALLVVSSGIASSFSTLRQLLLYMTTTSAGILVAAMLVSEPKGSLLLYLSYAGIMGVLALLLVGSRMRVEDELASSEQRYALAAHGANDGLWDWDLAQGTIYFSPRWKAMLGLSEEDVAAGPEAWLERIHEDDRERVRAALMPRGGEEGTTHIDAEYRIRHADGSWRWMTARGAVVYDDEGRPLRIAGSQSDITERKHAEEQLLHDALHDNLTGLANRALLLDRLDRLLQKTRRHPDYRFAVLFIDLDRFKRVNDSLGHGAGDALLAAVADRLGTQIRSEDTLARVGGDEFAVLLTGTSEAEHALLVARRLMEVLDSPFEVHGQQLHVRGSIGIAFGSSEYARPEAVLRDADIAMYRAKRSPTMQPQLFDEAMHEQVLGTLRLENELRQALEREEFVLHYQPIVLLRTARIVGFEALIRWNHPKRGILPPAAFLPLAEEMGLIHEIGSWVLREAARACRRWRGLIDGDEHPVVSVNVSASQFARMDLLEEIDTLLRDEEIDPEAIAIEVTESALMGNPEAAGELLTELKRRGIRVFIDDFGIGYSSLSYLHRLPADTLKIDRSFIMRIHDAGQEAELVDTILLLARKLGMRTIAEGIETPEQLDRLRALGARFGQGFLFSRPVDAEAAERLLVAMHDVPTEAPSP